MDDKQHNPLAWINEELGALAREGLLRELVAHEGPQTARVVLDGRELVHFGANDYLALAGDPRLTAAAALAAKCEGWGSGASPLVSGRAEAHRRLETRLAEFEGTEAALLFASGYAANSGTIAALADRGDAIFGDAKNHASIIDGCRLSRARVHVYPHGDTHALEEMRAGAGDYRRRLIVTDSLFSVDGDLAPLAELAGLAERYNAMLMVDEAHATGVFGERGRGVAEHLGVEDRVHVRVGTLSKALGGAGGFVCGPRSLIDWLANRARSYVFSTAHPAAVAAAGLAALEIVEGEPKRRTKLLERSATLRDALRRQGWNVGASASQIIPITVGAADRTMALSASLRQRGLFVPGIRPPSVPEGGSLLRVSLSYDHTPEMIERLIGALADLR